MMIDVCPIVLFVNRKKYEVFNADPTLLLNYWLRKEACLMGSKSMCNEGGCGSCVVLLQFPGEKPKAVNSCLVFLGSVNGCHITTVEGVGSSETNYHKIQTTLVESNAIQCGYCTPGFVVGMHGLLQENSSLTEQMIENAFDGNICRCTGYRPILDAMKCFACDNYQSSGDIEDLVIKNCQSQDNLVSELNSFQFSHGSTKWVRLVSFDELKCFFRENTADFKLICGNTGSGIFKPKNTFPVYVDVGHVAEFHSIVDNVDSIEFGASVTLSQLKCYILKKSHKSVTFEPIASYISKVASLPVRNTASWAGNVMLKYQHRNFPSDVCTFLQTGDATIKVYDVTNDAFSTHPVYGEGGIMDLNMENKIIVSMRLPKIKDTSQNKMKCFKVMPRSQNSYAYVNAAFLATLNGDRSKLNKVTLVFGAVSSSFHQAFNTEKYLSGKPINDNQTLSGALNELSKEVSFSCNDSFKINLVLGLFYKFYLSLCDDSQLGPGIASGIECLIRPVSSGTQSFKTDPSTYPVSKYVPKTSGLLLASGEAEFISDTIPSRIDLYCDVVLSRVGDAEIDVIDSSAAEQMPGFVKIITGDNFPADVKNTWLGCKEPTQTMVSTGKITHSGQVVAVVIAESLTAARKIAASVKVTYKNEKKPLISWKDALEANSFFDFMHPVFQRGDVDKAMAEAKHVVTGELVYGLQYHFYMETLVCKAERTDDRGFLIASSTQLQTLLQSALSYAFGISANKIEISTKRMGGAYGGKATNSQLPSCIAALSAHVTNRPVHFQTTLETCMKMLGSRTPYTVLYKLGFNGDGVITAVDLIVHTNSGCSEYDNVLMEPQHFIDNAYFCPDRRCKVYLLKTNLPLTTWCRAPDSMQMTASAELMVEHVANYLKKDPVAVKLANMYKIGQTDMDQIPISLDFQQIYQRLLTKYQIRERMQAIETFNQANRWKKKGLAVTPMKCRINSIWAKYGVLVSIYAFDGSVVISHGGIDSGQGITVKVAQVVAYRLGIPLDKVTVQRTNTLTSANSESTGGSVTSESVCRSAIACCDTLNSRINPVREKVGADLAWPELIKQCFALNVDLTASNMSSPSTDFYLSFGVTAAEVEYDVITGERQILQVDTVFDCGVSLNPAVDIGQIEGAFMMGVGFWLSEKMVYDETTGELLTDGTWEYKPPASQDIPIKWNIELLEDHPNPVGVLRSKASGEPPLCMSVCVALAMKRAVEAARKDRGVEDYFALPIPATVDALHSCCSLDPINDFVLN